jgi:hypothetical protein
VSYYTHVRIAFWGDKAATPDALLEAARPHLERRGYHVEHVSEDLAKGLREGRTELNDLRSGDVTDLFLVLSRRFPAATFRVWAIGEEPWDIWTRELSGGKVTFRRGPFSLPPNTSPNVDVVTLKAVGDGSLPVLRVDCVREGGEWMFLPGEGRGAPVYTVVTLGSLLERDPTLKTVLDLKPGWGAVRKKVGGPWVRRRLRAR